MSGVKKIRLFAMAENDRIVFSSLLSLLSFKTAYTCKIVEADADVAIVDVDNDEGKKIAASLAGQGVLLVCLSAHSPMDDAHHFIRKPLRSADVIEVIRLIEAGMEPVVNTKARGSGTVRVAKLLRWPPKLVLTEFPKAARMCAVFMNQRLAPDHAAEMVGVETAIVEKFLERCAEFDCIEWQTGSETPVTSTSAETKHASLFSKLRLKLGAR